MRYFLLIVVCGIDEDGQAVESWWKFSGLKSVEEV
jgi:hypothetical protein